MDAEDWRQRWANDQIGFHQAGGHPLLADYWPAIAPSKGERVLVPLCGKTRDMAWLAKRGHAVVGIELAERAARDFFRESERRPARTEHADHAVWQADWPGGGRVAIAVADFFAIEAPVGGRCPLWFDRAALAAMPAAQRDAYVAHLDRLLSHDARGLLITLDYPPNQIDGPPFAISDAGVRACLAPTFAAELLLERDVTAIYDHLVERGATRLDERVYRVTRG